MTPADIYKRGDALRRRDVTAEGLADSALLFALAEVAAAGHDMQFMSFRFASALARVQALKP